MRHKTLRRWVSVAAALVLSANAAYAINGGSTAGRNRLSQATVSIGTLVANSDHVSIDRCSGVLIAPDLVLTAAHCVSGDPLASVVRFYRGHKPSGQPIQVASLSRRTDALGDLPAEDAGLVQLSLDTAILRLVAPVRGRQPIRASRGDIPPAGLRLAGTGLSPEGLGTLKTTRLRPVAVTSTGLIVAEAIGAEVCKGDSGGPVVADGPQGPVLWGVASAVIAQQPPCGRLVIVAPLRPKLQGDLD